MSTLHIERASLTYGEKNVFYRLAMTLVMGQWTALLGRSGIGKSSLLRLLAGLIQPNQQVRVEMSWQDESFHQQIAYMAQSDLLLPWLTVIDNVTLGLTLRSASRVFYQQEKERAIQLLAQIGLTEVIHYYPKQLSGGMRQRVALVRTLMENKPIVLMDEPFSALDAVTRYQLQALAAKWLADKTVLFITHDPLEAIRLANEIYLMYDTPVKLKSIAQLTSAIPRELNHPDLISLHTQLLHTLLQGAS